MSVKKRKPYKRASRRNTVEIHNFIREWREYRGFKSQSELGAMAGIPSQTISRLESYTLAWTFSSLDKLARVLDCTPGDLISRHPARDAAIFEIYAKLPYDRRDQLVKFAKTLLPSGK